MNWEWPGFLTCFLVCFIAINVAIGFVCAKFYEIYYVNACYIAFVLVSAFVMKQITGKLISWAVFPYSNYVVQQHH
jgi:hypothetical protein